MYARTLVLAVLSASVGLVLSEPRISPHIVHEERSTVPSGWAKAKRHTPDAILPMRFGLAQSNMDRLDEYLMDVSHPDSPNFGKHWTAGDVVRTFSPSADSVDTVRDWLGTAGVLPSRLRLTPNKAWIELNVTVAEAEQLLATEYHVYGHESGAIHVACEKYHLPQHVSPHVEIVTPTIHFDGQLARRGKQNGSRLGQPGAGTVFPKAAGEIKTLIDELENCDSHITPICLRALYGIVYEPLAASKNSYGIVEYTPQAYVASDLDLFFTNYSKNLVGLRPTEVDIDGAIVQTTDRGFDYNGESNLDLQYAQVLVQNQKLTLYQTGDNTEGASFNNLLDAVDGSYCTFEGGDDPNQDGIYPDPYGGYEGSESCGIVKPANVISTSYGQDEAGLSAFYAQRQCAEYAKLGLMGVSVLFSSGDNGVAGNSNDCIDSNGNATASGKIFNPGFPATCPYVTAVGATQLPAGKKVTDPESATYEVIYSGGGFSNIFAMPSYQKSAVESYLKDHPSSYDKNVYNSTGTSRAFPDLSANGANYVVAIDGGFYLVFGTSASSPVVGAMLTLVNDARLAVGKKPIGFINPTIYSSSFRGAFHDITNGTNPGCGTDGFSAVSGWDPVTGLGTPNFPVLLAKWLLLP